MSFLNKRSPSYKERDLGSKKLTKKQVIDLDKAKKLRHLVVVALGDGFWVNIVRAVGRPILYLIGKAHLLTLVGKMKDGLDGVHAHAGKDTPSAPELSDAAQALARSLGVML